MTNTRHQWNDLAVNHLKKEYIHECAHCKLRRTKYLENGTWFVRYYMDRSIYRRFAPKCIRKNLNPILKRNIHQEIESANA